MAGRPPILPFAADADLAVDFLLQQDGAAVNLTGYSASLALANSSGSGGFTLSVGSGLLAPGSDGRVRARLPAAQLGSKRGAYDPCELLVTDPAGDVDLWLMFGARIFAGASEMIAAASALAPAATRINAWTVVINRTSAGVAVAVSSGVPAGDLIGALLSPVGVVEYTGPGVLVGALIGQGGTGPYAFSLTGDDGGRFAVSGSNLVAGSTPIRVADGSPQPLSLRVADQAGAVAVVSMLLPAFPATSPLFNLPAQSGVLPWVI